MSAPDCTGRHHLFPGECERCVRLLPVTGERPANPLLPDVRFGKDKWECVSFRAPDKASHLRHSPEVDGA